MITYIKGDIRSTNLPIAHGVNCQNKMGSGVAKALFDVWPEVKECYHMMFEEISPNNPDLLGITQKILCEHQVVYNLFTQLNYGYDGKKYVNYGAIAIAFKDLVDQGIKEIAIPKIGCGLAGGDWAFVEQLINDTVGDKMTVHVYYL